MLAQDRRLTLRLIVEELGINKDTAHSIVRNDLGKRKFCSRFVPHKLTDKQKAKRMGTSGDFISMCDQDPLLLENIVTTWCYQFDPESIGGVVFTDFAATKEESYVKSQGQNTVDRLLRQKNVSSIRNLSLQVKPLIPHFTRQF